MTAFWWAAGEEIEFARIGNGSVHSEANISIAPRRPEYVRASLYSPRLQVTGALLAEGMPIPAPRTDLWMSCEYGFQTALIADPPSIRVGEVGLGLSTVPTGGLFLARGPDSGNQMALWKETSTGVSTSIAAETGLSFGKDVLHRIDMHVTGFNTANGNVKVYLQTSPTPIIDFTGDLTISGVAALDCFRILANNTISVGLSEVILADEDTRGFAGVATLWPNGAGAVNNWTSGTYPDIAEVVLNDQTMIVSAIAGQEFDCALSDLVVGNVTIRGVKLTARRVNGTSGPSQLGLGIRSGGISNTVDQPPTTALASADRIMEVNPVTGQRFTYAEVQALEMCLKSVA